MAFADSVCMRVSESSSPSSLIIMKNFLSTNSAKEWRKKKSSKSHLRLCPQSKEGNFTTASFHQREKGFEGVHTSERV